MSGGSFAPTTVKPSLGERLLSLKDAVATRLGVSTRK
jgi:hypothetical protein